MGFPKIKGMGLRATETSSAREGYSVEAKYRRIPREVRVGSEWEFKESFLIPKFVIRNS